MLFRAIGIGLRLPPLWHQLRLSCSGMFEIHESIDDSSQDKKTGGRKVTSFSTAKPEKWLWGSCAGFHFSGAFPKIAQFLSFLWIMSLIYVRLDTHCLKQNQWKLSLCRLNRFVLASTNYSLAMKNTESFHSCVSPLRPWYFLIVYLYYLIL